MISAAFFCKELDPFPWGFCSELDPRICAKEMSDMSRGVGTFREQKKRGITGDTRVIFLTLPETNIQTPPENRPFAPKGPKSGFEKVPKGSPLGVSKDRGTPKWMVYNGKPY